MVDIRLMWSQDEAEQRSHHGILCITNLLCILLFCLLSSDLTELIQRVDSGRSVFDCQVLRIVSMN